MENNITEIVWTYPAKKELRDIYDYLSEFSEEAAFRIVNKIMDRTDVLKNGYTEIGLKELLLENKADDYRYLLEGNYKIIYRIKSDKIIIDTVFDARQNPQKLDKHTT
ncbi:MAG: type II toxin-antitoxin system RelE/ParE family toxin [bacterium]|nr:type II toxin-antitoxin system RelE/ParE family toxin [bacterium]